MDACMYSVGMLERVMAMSDDRFWFCLASLQGRQDRRGVSGGELGSESLARSPSFLPCPQLPGLNDLYLQQGIRGARPSTTSGEGELA